MKLDFILDRFESNKILVFILSRQVSEMIWKAKERKGFVDSRANISRATFIFV